MTVGGLGRSMVALTGARLVSVAAIFLAGVVAARMLTPAEMGVAGVGLTVGWAIAIFANGGLNISAIYFLGKGSVPAPLVVRRILALAIGSVLVAVLATAIVAPIVGSAVLGGQDPLLFVAAASMAVGTIGYEVAGALLLGLSRRGAYVVSDLLRSAGTLLGTLLVLFLVSRSPSGYVFASALGVLVPAVYSIFFVRQKAGTLKPSYDKEFAGGAIRMGLAGQVGNVLTFLNVRLDQLLVPAFVGLHAGGIYFVAGRVAEVVGQASTAASSMLFPHVAAQSDARATETTERTARLTLLATLGIAAVLAAISPVVLGLIFGAAYQAGTTALLLLLVAMVPLALSRVLAADLKGRGRPGMVSIGTGAGVVVILALDLILIPAYGITGAATAAIVAQSLTAAILLRCYRKVTGGSVVALLPRPSDVRLVLTMIGRRAKVAT